MKIPVFKCPHCGHNLGYAVNAHLYGSPMRPCPQCKKMYLDDRYHEIALEGIRREDIDPTALDQQAHRKKGRNAIWLGIGLLVLFGLILLVGLIVFPLPIVGVICIISGISILREDPEKELAKTRAALELEKQQSFLRVQDPQYIAQLQAMGYRFPQQPAPVPAPATGFCRHCGAQLAADASFCGKCGAPNR